MRKKQAMKDMSGDFPGLIFPDDEVLRNAKGKWQEFFEEKNPLWLELGPGRGKYLIELAKKHPERNFVGLDVKIDRLVQIALKVKAKALTNIVLAPVNYRWLDKYFENGELSGAIVNFPEPRIKAKQSAWRFSHPENLEQLVKTIGLGGELWFKTDDPLFFEWSYPFLQEVLDIEYETRDLSHTTFYENEPKTEYEERWVREGKLFASLKGKVKKLTIETPIGEKTWKTRLHY